MTPSTDPLLEIAYPCREYGVQRELSQCSMADVAKKARVQPHENYPNQARMMIASVIHPDNEVLLHTFGSPEFLKSPEGAEYVKEFDRFFLEVLADTLPKAKQNPNSD